MDEDTKLLFFGKHGHWATKLCLDFLENLSIDTENYLGQRGDPFPQNLDIYKSDYIISFSSPWIIPKPILDSAQIASLNFHPGSPEYPGIGCTNFAIYNQETTFGVTCHHMVEEVDKGPIVQVRRFPIYSEDGVQELTNRCYHHLYALFVDIIGTIIMGQDLPKASESWKRKPYTRRQLNELCQLNLDMDTDEMKRRVRAVWFPGHPGACLEINGIKFEASVDKNSITKS